MSGNAIGRRAFLKTTALATAAAATSTPPSLASEPRGRRLSQPDIKYMSMPARGAIDFFDPRTVEHTYFLDRRVTPVTKHDSNPLLTDCMPKTILLKDGRGFWMWYATRTWLPHQGGKGKRTEHDLCYAESTDGIAWTVPRLGLKERDGGRANSILIRPNDRHAKGEQLTGAGGIEGWHVVDAEQNPMPKARGRYTAMYITGLK